MHTPSSCTFGAVRTPQKLRIRRVRMHISSSCPRQLHMRCGANVQLQQLLSQLRTQCTAYIEPRQLPQQLRTRGDADVQLRQLPPLLVGPVARLMSVKGDGNATPRHQVQAVVAAVRIVALQRTR